VTGAKGLIGRARKRKLPPPESSFSRANIMPIDLPKDPTGTQYEDLVAIALSVSGHFIEAQLRLRDSGHEVLELDIVATPQGLGAANRRLYEVKKEAFSFANMFKLFGQSRFLGISEAALVSEKGCKDDWAPTFHARANEMQIALIHLPIDAPTLKGLGRPPNGLQDDQVAVLSGHAWYGSIARRLALGHLRTESKRSKDSAPHTVAKIYEFNSRASFFLKTPLERAEALYQAYFASPGMSKALLSHSVGRTPTVEDWNRVNDSHDLLSVQAMMDLETKARLAIVKNALDDFLERGQAPPPTTTLRIGSLALEVPAHGLPPNFWRGIEQLAASNHAARLPYLFQAFYLLFGGFLTLDDDRDLDLLSKLTGVPKAEIRPALLKLDSFFGQEKSFFFEIKSSIFAMKMVPGIVRGGGAIFRRGAHAIEDYSELCPTMGWLLSKWHNAAYHALEPELGI
jgi:hypothetical protein